jgi:hypothetical protein
MSLAAIINKSFIDLSQLLQTFISLVFSSQPKALLAAPLFVHQFCHIGTFKSQYEPTV